MPPSQTRNGNGSVHSLGNRYGSRLSKHLTYEMSFKHSSCAISKEWVDNNIQWRIGSSGELLCQDIIRWVDLVSLYIWSTVNVCIHCLYFSLLLLNTLSALQGQKLILKNGLLQINMMQHLQVAFWSEKRLGRTGFVELKWNWYLVDQRYENLLPSWSCWLKTCFFFSTVPSPIVSGTSLVGCLATSSVSMVISTST